MRDLSRRAMKEIRTSDNAERAERGVSVKPPSHTERPFPNRYDECRKTTEERAEA